jgi:xanthine dehydrogenase accessory factor
MRLSQFLDTNADIVRVSLCRVRGSSPREAGAEMFVTPNGLHGTIGGGQLEYMAIDQARKMLGSGRDFDRMDVPLGPEIGQCCGGRVELALQRMTQADRAQALAAGEGAFIVLTHDHALDFLLTSEALDRRDAAYVGLIGSATKRMKFARFHQSHAAQSDCTRLICPIGDASSPDKRPEVIAASVTAQVMSVLTTAQSEDVKLTI